jgi:hypothetical protein
MARGATKTAENTAQGIGTQAKGVTSTGIAESGQEYGALMPQIASMMLPGGNPAVTAAMMGALGSSFGGAKQSTLDNATRTNNAASTNATEDQLARQQGTAAAQAAANNVMDQQQDATGLLSKMFGQTSQNTTAGLNAQTGANNSYIGGINSGNGILNKILGLAGNGVQGAAKAIVG